MTAVTDAMVERAARATWDKDPALRDAVTEHDAAHGCEIIECWERRLLIMRAALVAALAVPVQPVTDEPGYRHDVATVNMAAYALEDRYTLDRLPDDPRTIAQIVLDSAVPEQREALDEETRGLTVTDEWGSLLDTTERCPICRRKWSKHDDFDEAHFAVAEDVASMLADLAAAPVQPVTDEATADGVYAVTHGYEDKQAMLAVVTEGGTEWRTRGPKQGASHFRHGFERGSYVGPIPAEWWGDSAPAAPPLPKPRPTPSTTHDENRGTP